jgi:dolichol kinase
MKNMIKSWKTTIAGIIVGGVAVAVALGYITTEVGGQITGVCIALGLIVSKDGNQTGVAN